MGQTPQDYYIFPNSLSRRWKVFGRRSKKGFGAVEILVNNAGVAPAADFLEMADKLCDEVMRVNVYGAYNCCKTFLAPMIDGRGVASSTSLQPWPALLIQELPPMRHPNTQASA